MVKIKKERLIFILILGMFLIVTTSIYSLDYPSTTITITYSGNLTNLSELYDTNIPAPTDGQSLTWDSGTARWIASTVAGGGGAGNLSGTVGIYIYDDGSLAYFNETQLNLTIDARASGLGDNSSWNESYADGIYALAGSGNASWNESYANTLYSDFSFTDFQASFDFNISNWEIRVNDTYLSTYNETYAGLINNASYLSTYNATYDSNEGNLSWNESYANTLYTSTYNATYAGLISNESYLSTYNETYAGSINNDSYLSTYNATYDGNLDSNCSDGTCITVLYRTNESDLNVNGSDYWDDMGSINATQMEDNEGVLNILESWMSTLFDTLFSAKSTDDLSEGDNKYDNASWNESYANGLYSDFSFTDFQASFNLNITDWETRVNASYLSTYNATYDANEGNSSWNESYADTLYADAGSIGGNPFDQDLNKTNHVTFANITLGNADEDIYIYFYDGGDSKGRYILWDDGSSDFFFYGSLRTNNNVTAGYFIGDGSELTNIAGSNSSWNESYANTLYTSTYNETYAGLISNESYLSTYNATYDANEGNISWNESYANDLYVNITGDDMTGNLTNTEWFNGEFNWTTTDEWSSFDGSTFNFNESKLSTEYFLASSIQVVTGTGAGSLADIQTYNQTTYNVTEVASDFELIVNFTGITEFTTLLVRHKTDTEAGHIALIQIWDYDASAWKEHGKLIESTIYETKTLGIYCGTNHIQDGVVQIRFYQDEGPPNTAHVHQFDWVGISKGYGTPVGQEIDPHSVHRDGNTPLTANWDAGSFNITADYFVGDGSRLTNVAGGNLSWNESYADTLYSSTYNATYDSTTSEWDGNKTALIGSVNNASYLSTYNATYAGNLDTNCSDGSCEVVLYWTNESILNTNQSDYWDNLGSINATQMEDNGGVLNIMESWLSTLFDTLFGAKDTDDLSEGSTNLYDNVTWNESHADTLYAGIGSGNSSWNQSYASTLYAGIEWDYNQSLATQTMWNDVWLSTYNATYLGSVNNASYLSTYNATYDTNLDTNCTDDGSCPLITYDSELTYTTDTNASTICSGDTTYLDGEGNCDDISSVYLTAMDYTNIAMINESNTFTENQNMSDNNITTVDYMKFTGGGYIYDNSTTLILGHS